MNSLQTTSCLANETDIIAAPRDRRSWLSNDFHSDIEKYNLTVDSLWSAQTTNASSPLSDEGGSLILSPLAEAPKDDIKVDYRVNKRLLSKSSSSTPTYYPAPNEMMGETRRFPGARYVKLHGCSAVSPIVPMNAAPYAMLTKVTKIHGLSDRLSLRSQLQSQASTAED